MQRQRSFGMRSGRPKSPYCDLLCAPEKLGVALTTAEKLVEQTNAVSRLNNMGVAHMEASNYEEAIALFRRALQHLELSPAAASTATVTSAAASTDATPVSVTKRATSSSSSFSSRSSSPDCLATPSSSSAVASMLLDKANSIGGFNLVDKRLSSTAGNKDTRPLTSLNHQGSRGSHSCLHHHNHCQPTTATSSNTNNANSNPTFTTNTTKEDFIYQRREYDEGMNMYYVPIRMDASTMDCSTVGNHHHHRHHPQRAAATILLYYNLGQAHLRQDRDEEAQKYFEMALQHHHHQQRRHQQGRVPCSVAQQTAAFQHHHVAPFKVLHNLGYIQYRAQNIQAAIQTFRHALAESRQSMHALDVANSLNCLGVLYFHLPEPDAVRSMECYLQALTIRKEIFGPTHVDVATCLNNIGRVHYIEQRYGDALMVYEEALRIRRLLLGGDHLDVAGTYHVRDVAAFFFGVTNCLYLNLLANTPLNCYYNVNYSNCLQRRTVLSPTGKA